MEFGGALMIKVGALAAKNDTADGVESWLLPKMCWAVPFERTQRKILAADSYRTRHFSTLSSMSKVFVQTGSNRACVSVQTYVCLPSFIFLCGYLFFRAKGSRLVFPQ